MRKAVAKLFIGGSLWQSYWLTLISAMVENAEPTHVVLTFPSARTSLVASDFTIAGFTINSASWTGAILTLVLNKTVVYGDVLVVTFVKTGQTHIVTNNVDLTDEIETYITGLITSLSNNQKILLNNFVLSLKSGLSITNLSDAFDCIWLIAGETKESSYKNLVKNAHHLTDGVAPTWTQFEGVEGNGTTQYIHSNYIPLVDKVVHLYNDCSLGCYTRIESPVANSSRIGVYDYNNDSQSIIRSKINASVMKMGLNCIAAVEGSEATFNKGLNVITRNASDVDLHHAYNQRIESTAQVSSGTLPNKQFYLLALNENATPDTTPRAWSDDQLSFVFVGKYLNKSQIYCIQDAIMDYMYSVGKEVCHTGLNAGLSIGRELMIDSAFDSPDKSVWTYAYGDWVVAGGVVHKGASSQVMRQRMDSFRLGKTYKLKFRISNCSGSAWLNFISNAVFPWAEFPASDSYGLYANGDHVLTLTCVDESDVWMEIASNNASPEFDLDNVSLVRLD